MAKIYYDKDVSKSSLKDKLVGVIGYGSQGHAHALNLKDSGVDVVVGLYQGSSSVDVAKKDGLRVENVSQVAKEADIIAILVPDTKQAQVYNESIKPHLSLGKTLLFAHGFTIHYDQIQPPSSVNVVMIAPKGPGHRVRQLYEDGFGIPCLIAVENDCNGEAFDTALAYGSAIGGGRAGILETTFKEETETDLFGEQTVLCGVVLEAIKAGFEVLIEEGYQPESAYFEVLHELKLITDLVYQGGLGKMLWSISDTAEYGAYVSGPKLVDSEFKERMRGVLKRIQTGEFARKWIAENNEGLHEFNALRKKSASHPVEDIGKNLRAMMPWLEKTL